MIKDIERVISQMDDGNIEALADFAARAAARRTGIREFATRSLLSSGFEFVEADGNVMPDGRVVLAVNGSTFALKREVHEARMREALDAARVAPAKSQAPIGQQEPPARVVKEELSATACPQMIEGKPCGGALNKKGVCPACVAGQMGYRYRYSCEKCSFDVVTKTELR